MQLRSRAATRAVSRSGFTLMEILVVVAIIVVLAAVGGYYVLPRLEESKEKLASAKLKILDDACGTYHVNNGDWPPSLEALAMQQPTGGAPIIDAEALRDPWGNPFGYDPTGAHNNGMKPDVWVNRPNGQIGNWAGGHHIQ
jgi:general secretion pathway protein G